MEKIATSIRIEICDQNDEVIAAKRALTYETAVENIYKLQRYVERNNYPSELV